MKKMAIILLTTVLMTSLFISEISADENSEEILINEYKEDVTGNGIKESVKLYGILLSSDSEFYRDIYAIVQTKSGKSWEVNYKGGYNPKLEFIDLTHNKINDMMFQSGKNKRNGPDNYHIHSIEQNELIETTLPSQAASGEFIDDFQAKLTLAPNKSSITFNLGDNTKEYIEAGVYNNQGKLIEKKSLLIQPVAHYEPVFISESKGYGLKSHQHVNGTKDSNQLGTIETLWYYENDNWIILQTDWLPTMT